MASAYQLNDVRNGLDKYYKQYCNIALDPNTHFPSIGTYSNEFTGTYDGNNFKITGFYQNNYTVDIYTTGLFGYNVNPSILKNIWLYGKIDIPSSINLNMVGLLVSMGNNTITMTINNSVINCHCYGLIKAKANYMGGLGGNGANISNCSAEVDIVWMMTDQFWW